LSEFEPIFLGSEMIETIESLGPDKARSMLDLFEVVFGYIKRPEVELIFLDDYCEFLVNIIALSTKLDSKRLGVKALEQLREIAADLPELISEGYDPNDAAYCIASLALAESNFGKKKQAQQAWQEFDDAVDDGDANSIELIVHSTACELMSKTQRIGKQALKLAYRFLQNIQGRSKHLDAPDQSKELIALLSAVKKSTDKGGEILRRIVEVVDALGEVMVTEYTWLKEGSRATVLVALTTKCASLGLPGEALQVFHKSLEILKLTHGLEPLKLLKPLWEYLGKNDSLESLLSVLTLGIAISLNQELDEELLIANEDFVSEAVRSDLIGVLDRCFSELYKMDGSAEDIELQKEISVILCRSLAKQGRTDLIEGALSRIRNHEVLRATLIAIVNKLREGNLVAPVELILGFLKRSPFDAALTCEVSSYLIANGCVPSGSEVFSVFSKVTK
jgi:hypothetical protein